MSETVMREVAKEVETSDEVMLKIFATLDRLMGRSEGYPE
jgi:hypothetical protein